MLRRWVDGGARDDELSEELRAFVEHENLHARTRLRTA